MYASRGYGIFQSRNADMTNTIHTHTNTSSQTQVHNYLLLIGFC